MSMELAAVKSTPLHPVMVGSSKTAGQENVVEPSSLLQEMTVRLKHKIRKMNKTFFIRSAIPKVKYYCLCFRRTQYIPEFGGICKNWEFFGRVSDCEELVILKRYFFSKLS